MLSVVSNLSAPEYLNCEDDAIVMRPKLVGMNMGIWERAAQSFWLSRNPTLQPLNIVMFYYQNNGSLNLFHANLYINWYLFRCLV